MSSTTESPQEPGGHFYEVAKDAAKQLYEMPARGKRGHLPLSRRYFIIFDCVESRQSHKNLVRLVDRLVVLGHRPLSLATYPTSGSDDGLCQVLVFEGDSEVMRLVIATWELVEAEESGS